MYRFFLVVGASFFLVGCGSSQTTKEEIQYEVRNLSGGVIRSMDFGTSFEPYVQTVNESSLSKVQVFSLDFAYGKNAPLYMGSEESGLFGNIGDGEKWQKMPFPPEKIYDFKAYYDDLSKTTLIYATGVYEKRGKIYKSENGGEDWNEIYTEPANNTTVLALETHPSDANIIYAGTSEGIAIKSIDGGKTWSNLHVFDAPVYSIALDALDPETVYFLLYGDSLVMSRDGGKTLVEENRTETLSRNEASDVLKKLPQENVSSIAVDPTRGGRVYVGTENGIYQSEDYGSTWKRLKVIESIAEFPVRSIAISPFNSNEIVFGAAKILYRSVNNGESWQTYQLDADATPGHIVFDPIREGTLYVGLRSF